MVILLQVTIQDIHGDKFEVQIQNDVEVIGLKLQIWEQKQIPLDNQRLVFAGRQLSDDENVGEIGVISGATIFLVRTDEAQQAPPAVQPAAVVPSSYVQPQNAFVPAAQPMNIQQPPAAEPVVVVPARREPQETCCCCIPLRAGVLVLIILHMLLHLSMVNEIWLLAVVAILFDAVGIYGWAKKSAKHLKAYMFFMIFNLCIQVVGGVVFFVFAINRKYPRDGYHRHHHHHSHGGRHNDGGNAQGYPTSTVAPHHLSTQTKVHLAVVFGLLMLVIIAIESYFILSVGKYVKMIGADSTMQGGQARDGGDEQQQQQGQAASRHRRINVGGAVYERV